ncbi:MAG: hypothetical protein Q6368_006555 [Candidatus Baldrarchaeota archaeon]
MAELKQLQIQAFKEFYLSPKWIAKQLVREGRKFLNVLKQILRVLIKSRLKGIIGFHPRLQTLVKTLISLITHVALNCTVITIGCTRNSVFRLIILQIKYVVNSLK